MKLHIKNEDYQSIQITKETSSFDIVVDKCINASLMISYTDVDAMLPITMHLAEDSSLTVLMKKDAACAMQLDIHADIYKDAHLTLALLDMEDHVSNVRAQVVLKEHGARADVQSACVVNDLKHFQITCIHEQPYTTGIMKHYAVVNTSGKYHMEACGQITKGAYGSESHQTTRVLTMSEEHDSEVIPLLLIDEHDVKASHATTLGQPDENQLYYLQTRGLSRTQALGLLSVGYMMPITEVIQNQQVQEQLKDEIEMKVGLHA